MDLIIKNKDSEKKKKKNLLLYTIYNVPVIVLQL